MTKLPFVECVYVQGRGFPCGAEVKNLPASAGDLGSVPESGRSLGGGNGNPLQYSYLGNSMDRGTWWAAVMGSQKSWTQLSNQTTNVKSMGPTSWGSVSDANQ